MFRLCLVVKISYPVGAVQSAKFARISILRNNRKYFILLSFSLNLIIEWKRQGVLAGKDRTGGGWGNEETSVERQTGQKAYWKIFTLSASQSLRIFWNLSRTCETKADYKIHNCDIPNCSVRGSTFLTCFICSISPHTALQVWTLTV